MDRLTEETLSRAAQALHAAFQPKRAEIEAALREVLNFNPEVTPAQFYIPSANPLYGAADARKKSVKDSLAEDARAPFATESYLYNLFGKDDARTLLAHLRTLCRALGFELEDLVD